MTFSRSSWVSTAPHQGLVALDVDGQVAHLEAHLVDDVGQGRFPLALRGLRDLLLAGGLGGGLGLSGLAAAAC